MKGNKFIVMGMAMLLVAGILSPLAAAENDSLHVIMTVEDRNYSVGDTITVELRIYDKGVLTDLADPGDAYLGMSTNHNLNNPNNITVAKQATGVYRGTYTVKASDNYRNLYFFYSVTLGTDTEEGRSTIRVYSVQDTVDVTIGGQKTIPAKPGDSLIATVLVRTGGTPIPVSGFTHLYLETPSGQRQNLTQTIRDVGIYDVNVIVPSVSASGMYMVVAQPIDVGESDTAYIFVNVLDVWYHKISTAGNTVSFELCVANNDGEPVAGANFVLQRNGWPQESYYGTTNASGKYLVHVPDIAGQVGFSGYVLAGGLNQTITGAVFNNVDEQPHHSDFDIVWEGDASIFKTNTDVSIPYGAYAARVPASGRTIHYYVTARGTDFAMFGGSGNHPEIPRAVIAAGTVTTSDLGNFNIAFKTPAKQCAIDIRLEVPLDSADFPGQEHDQDDDKYYAVWPENTWNTDGFIFYAYEGRLDGDKGVSLKIGSFKPGKKAGHLTIELNAALGDPVHILWGVGEYTLGDTGNYDPEWMRWVPAGNIAQAHIDEDGKYQADFLLPSFITEQDVTVAAGYVDSSGLPHFDVKTKSPGGGVPWLWIGIIIIILVVVIGLYVAKEKMLF